MNIDSPINNLINGVPADYLSINDRAIHYGDGLFETILCHRGKLSFWKKHYQRLQSSAVKINLPCPQEHILLNDIELLLADKHNADEPTCVIKIILTRGVSNRGYAFDNKSMANRLVLLSVIDKDYSSLLSTQLLSGDLYLCDQQVSINESLAGLKHLNRLENVLAKNEWQQPQYIDGLMLNANGNVIEGCMSNLFAIKGEEVLTPDLTMSGVNGVIRNVVIEIAKANKIELTIKNMNVEELKSMDALFITNSLIGMKIISNFNGYQFGSSDLTDIVFNQLLESEDKYAQAI